MIQKLKKRRPSDSKERTAELSVKIPNSGYVPYRLDSATSRGAGAPSSAPPLAGLPDIFSNQGDFRGSVIIDSLSKRFSVLRAKASPVRSTFPNIQEIPGNYTPHLAGIDDIRNRLAVQRQNAKGMGRYVSEDEENLVLEELSLPEDDTGTSVLPLRTNPGHDDRQISRDSSGSRTYGFGATAGMKEAEVLMKAHNGKRSVSDRSLASISSNPRPEPPASEYREAFTSQAQASGKRKSLLAILPLETQERITEALMEIEEDIQAEAMEESMLSEVQPSETLTAYVNEGVSTPEKSHAARPTQHTRQNSSITRSPFKDNLAQIAKGIDMDESGSPHSRTHSNSSSHSRGASSISIAQPDFLKSVAGINSASSSRQSSRLGHSRTGSSIDLSRFRFGSGLAERVEDVSNAFTLPPPPPAPNAALPPIPQPPPETVPPAQLEDAPDEAERTPQGTHQRTPSASASPIPTASFETGYVPGSVRPFTSATVRSDSPLEMVSNYKFAHIAPLATGRGATAPPLVRKASKVIPPNRPGPLLLQPTLTSHTVTASSSLPSVSPVVETFADSAERKGYTVPGPYSSEVLDDHAEQTVQYGQTLSPTGNLAVPQNPQLESPLDVSFDIDGYYGEGRSPVQAVIDPPLEDQMPDESNDVMTTPSLSEPKEMQDRHVSRKASAETLRSTFTENSSELPSPMLDHFPHLVTRRIGSSAESPLADVFGSDDEFEGDDAEQELYDELDAMQERLLEAAREVRRGLNAGTRSGDKGRKDVSPGLRTRPSIRRRPEPSMYPDMGENVSQLVRAMSPRQPSESSLRKVVSSPLVDTYREDTSRGLLEPSPAFNDYTSGPRDSPSPTPVATVRSPDLSFAPTARRMSSVEPPIHSTPPSAWSAIDSDETQMQKAPTHQAATPVSTHIVEGSPRPILSPGSTSRKPEDDINRVRDFEARIAQATAQLKTTPSVRTKRRPSTKGGAAMTIGTPTLINSSANIKVTPIPLSQLDRGTPSPSPSPKVGHARHQSSSAVTGEKGTGMGGLKGFVAKIKRNASLADRKRPKPCASSPRTANDTFQPFATISPITKSVAGSAISKPVPVHTAPQSDNPPVTVNPAIRTGPTIQTRQELPSRKTLVRRTIILSDPTDEMEEMPDIEVPAVDASAMGRRPSTRRKPVRHLSGDTEIFRAEGLLSPESQSISQVMSASRDEADNHRKSATDSLYDMYTGDTNEDEEDQEEVIYSGASASFEDDVHPDLHGLSRSTNPRAIEIREMSNGETTWSLLDINDPLLRGIGPSGPSSAHPRNISGTSSLSSYGQESLATRGSGFENGAAEIRSGPSDVARPKTNVSILSQAMPVADLRNKIFYSHENDVAELIDDLSRNGFEGKFRIVSPTVEQSPGAMSPSEAVFDKDAGSNTALGGVEKKLQALMQRMRTPSVSPSS